LGGRGNDSNVNHRLLASLVRILIHQRAVPGFGQEVYVVSGFVLELGVQVVSGFVLELEVQVVSGFVLELEVHVVSGFVLELEVQVVSGFVLELEVQVVSGSVVVHTTVFRVQGQASIRAVGNRW